VVKKNNNDFHFEIPDQNVSVKTELGAADKAAGIVKEDISLYYLLQHYNKDNAEAYRRKKERERLKKQAEKEAKINRGKKVAHRIEIPEPMKESESAQAAKTTSNTMGHGERASAEIAQDNGRADQKPFAATAEQRQNFGQTFYIRRGEERFINPESAPRGEPQNQPLFFQKESPEARKPIAQTAFMAAPEEEQNKTVLWEQAPLQIKKTATLRNIVTMETITINKTPFHIGRNPEMADLLIKDNNLVSGLHAVVDLYRDTFFVVDKSSLNGVFLNGVRIEPETEYVLESGIILAFANEQFVFQEK